MSYSHSSALYRGKVQTHQTLLSVAYVVTTYALNVVIIQL